MPINSSSGNASEVSMPTSNSHWMMPWVSPAPSIIWLSTPELGRFTRIAPKPMGNSSVGSYSFLMASQMSTAPTTYMTTCCQVMDNRPSHKNSIVSFILPFLKTILSRNGEGMKKDLCKKHRSCRFKLNQGAGPPKMLT